MPVGLTLGPNDSVAVDPQEGFLIHARWTDHADVWIVDDFDPALR